MKWIWISLIGSLIALSLPLVMPLERLAPKATPLAQERVKGFAETEGVSCQWITPTGLQYIKSGRPKLRPSVICRLRLQPEGEPQSHALQVRQSVRSSAIRFFAQQDILIGFTTLATNSPLTCLDPLSQVPWTRCEGDPNLGCLLAKCQTGLPPE